MEQDLIELVTLAVVTVEVMPMLMNFGGDNDSTDGGGD